MYSHQNQHQQEDQLPYLWPYIGGSRQAKTAASNWVSLSGGPHMEKTN